jgi:hypothetical protein
VIDAVIDAVIDTVAWVRLEHGRILCARPRAKGTRPHVPGRPGTLAPSSEIDELAWFCYADRSRVPPVDQMLFDDLNAAGQLH